MSHPILDHVAILASYEALSELPRRLQGLLHVVDGGASTGGITTNKLIFLPDGCYIEIIAFKPDSDLEKRRAHRWSHMPEGQIIDWGFTLQNAADFALIQQRVAGEADAVEGGYCYGDVIPGGRIRPDGKEVKWMVSLAEDTSGGTRPTGIVPFWCLDETHRDLRVPYQDKSKHPSGIRGISRIEVAVSQKDLGAVRQVYRSIYGEESIKGNGSQWPFWVHSGSNTGIQQIWLKGSADKTPYITLSLLGGAESPIFIEILPGIKVDIIP